MIRKLKAFSLALVAVLVMSAVVASAASAVEFHSEVATTVIKGEQAANNVVHFGVGNELSCATVKYNGEQTAATTQVWEVRPTFAGCVGFGFAKIDTNTTECTLWINANTLKSWYENSTHDNVCPSIDVTPTLFGSSQCTIKLKPGTNIYNVDIANEGALTMRDVKVTWTFTNIPYEEVAGGSCGVGNGNGGELTGTITFKGFNAGGTQVGIWRQ